MRPAHEEGEGARLLGAERVERRPLGVHGEVVEVVVARVPVLPAALEELEQRHDVALFQRGDDRDRARIGIGRAEVVREATLPRPLPDVVPGGRADRDAGDDHALDAVVHSAELPLQAEAIAQPPLRRLPVDGLAQRTAFA